MSSVASTPLRPNHALQITAAHREDLVSRRAAPAALPAPPPVPRVLALLQGGA